MSDPFSVKDIEQYQVRLGDARKAIDAVINDQYEAIGSYIRLHVVKPFCQKFDLTYDTGMGSYSFKINYPGADFGKFWDVGSDPRPRPGRPVGHEGNTDYWFVDVTDEERAIAKLLDMKDYDGRWNLGAWVPDYPDAKEL